MLSIPVNKRHLCFMVLFVLLSGCRHLPQREVLFQASTIQALSAGVYDGQTDLRELKKKGDFGLGTFQGLEGEMVALDGNFYQVKADGNVYRLREASGVPFAQVTFFDADKVFTAENELDYAQLRRYLDGLLDSRNIFYAVKISGRFKYVKVRSVPRQAKPYPELGRALKEEKVFELRGIEGTAVGFRCPGYSENIFPGGYHLHFISRDKISGGHLLDFSVSGARIEVDQTPDLYLSLPMEKDFLDLELSAGKEEGGRNE